LVKGTIQDFARLLSRNQASFAFTVTLRYGAGEDDTIGGRKGPPGTPIINSKTTGTPNITINRGHAERQGETEHWPRLGDRHNKQYPDKGVGSLAARSKEKAPHVRGFALRAELNSHQARESRDKPRLNAFCRVAPSVRFKVRAMLAARVFFLAAVFRVRTSAADHERRFDFLGINNLQVRMKGACS
jgi:hypothetical protein